MVEVESFMDAGSAEVFAAALRAAGLQPQVSTEGALAALGAPTTFAVLVPASEVVTARQLLDQGRAFAEEGERHKRSDWLKVPSAVIEAGLAEIRNKLRVMWWSMLAMPVGLVLAMVPLAIGWSWLSVIVMGLALGFVNWRARDVDRSICPRCREHYFPQGVGGVAKYLDASCNRCGLPLRES